jgi:alkaline phosphatase
MVESGRIDKYSHSLDWERAVYDTIMLDNAVKVAKDWAKAHGDNTLIIVTPDHTHPVSIIGSVDDSRPGTRLRDKIATSQDAGFPNYPKPDADGYPETVDVSRRLAFSFGTFPDHCTDGKPFLNGEFKPAVESSDGKSQVANEEFCAPGSTRMQGNLPVTAKSGAHSADDGLLTATGPGSERFHGHLENTKVFRYMAMALGLAK